MMRARLWTVHDERWRDLLRRLPHDIYHLPGYVRICAQRENGEALAAHVVSDEGELFVPFVRHALPTPWLDGWHDVTSPYGYAGPLLKLRDGATREAGEAFLSDALEHLCDLLLAQRVATAFVRFSPVLPLPMRAFARAGQLVMHGHTVAMDLTLSEEAMWGGIRDNHRRGIRRSERLGHRVEHDSAWSSLDDFVEVYRETMDRVSAASSYYFDRAYFESLRSIVDVDRLHLFTVKDGDVTLAAALFAETDGLVQYHLGGTRTAALAHHPHKVLYWTVVKWAKARGCRLLHLGGGLGGREDSLFHFKSGFSGERRPFHTWRKILNAELVESMLVTMGIKSDESDFFPAYRRSRPDE